MRFRKKPVVIEAVQLRWSTWNEMCDFLGGIIGPDNPGRSVSTYSDTCGEDPGGDPAAWIELDIPTMEGLMVARHGDWIIKGVQGEFYPCRPDIFEETYGRA